MKNYPDKMGASRSRRHTHSVAGWLHPTREMDQQGIEFGQRVEVMAFSVDGLQIAARSRRPIGLRTVPEQENVDRAVGRECVRIVGHAHTVAKPYRASIEVLA